MRETQEHVFVDYKGDGFCERLAFYRRVNLPVVVANGVFDLLHPGHVDLLEYAAMSAAHKPGPSVLIVALNSDASVRRIKGHNRPYLTFADRARMLVALRCVQCVVGFDEDTPEGVLSVIKPDVLVKGEEYRGTGFIKGSLHCKAVVLAPERSKTHTSSIVEKIRRREE